MSNTKAKWFTFHRKPGGSSKEEPTRPRAPVRKPYRPNTNPSYPVPRDYPPGFGDDPKRRPYWESDPRFAPGRELGPPLPKESGARPLREFGRRAARKGLRVGFGEVLVAADAADYIRDVFWPNPLAAPILPSNYVWCKGPWMDHAVYGGWATMPYFAPIGACSISGPVDHQAGDITQAVNRFTQYSHYLCRDSVLGPHVRSVIGTADWRSSPPGPWSPTFPQSTISLADPNGQRWDPLPHEVFPERAPLPEWQIGTATTLNEPVAFANPDLPYQADYQWIWQPGIGFQLDPGEGIDPGSPPDAPVGPSEPPIEPVKREPPEKGEKHRKVITKSAKIGIALFKALDAVSESAEVVDAIYQALPKDVRKRWEKALFPDARWIKDKRSGKWVQVGVDRAGDNFGQYGIGGADWKLRVLWHNWHKVDVEQAVKNIIKNELTDKIIGGIDSKLPRNSGNAHSDGERALSHYLDEFFSEELGL